MDLSEEKAKEILDFLARKIGYDNICVIKSMHELKHDVHSNLIVCKFSNKRTCHILCDAHWMPIDVCSSSYAKILECLLEMSKDGKDIFGGSNDKLFLHAYISLEEILIEMDLKRNELK